ncbi:hypothetical protein DPEC_G00199910 [Dallia pectoralis]|uniref:Uncharacterized protein n=1 Tax=Dallia pectoralis TaxID=75939 RepID=A0ACC2G925_DALPE|nr:hypothetical protein DPEC_G00199910 [Dallia pectoralis]
MPTTDGASSVTSKNHTTAFVTVSSNQTSHKPSGNSTNPGHHSMATPTKKNHRNVTMGLSTISVSNRTTMSDTTQDWQPTNSSQVTHISSYTTHQTNTTLTTRVSRQTVEYHTAMTKPNRGTSILLGSCSLLLGPLISMMNLL